MNAMARRRVLRVMSAGLLAPSMIARAWAQSAVPDTAAGLQGQLTAVCAAVREKNDAKAAEMIAALRLPNAPDWFRRVFGQEASVRLASEYATVTARFEPQVQALFAQVVAKGQSDIRVLRFTRADDSNAVGHQRTAIGAMQSPQPLYSARFVKPGDELGMHLYSFVHADGAFRLAGKLAALSA